jgi:hypothetical protein
MFDRSLLTNRWNEQQRTSERQTSKETKNKT